MTPQQKEAVNAVLNALSKSDDVVMAEMMRDVEDQFRDAFEGFEGGEIPA